MNRFATGTVILAGLWLLTLGSADPLDVVLGLALGGAIMLALGKQLRASAVAATPVPLLTRVVWFPVFAGAVLVDIARGTWDVSLRILSVRSVERPGIVCVPIGDRSERGVAVSALTTTLSPGSVLLDVDWDRREMQWHVIDASDPDAVRAQFQDFYDRYQRKVFP